MTFISPGDAPTAAGIKDKEIRSNNAIMLVAKILLDNRKRPPFVIFRHIDYLSLSFIQRGRFRINTSLGISNVKTRKSLIFKIQFYLGKMTIFNEKAAPHDEELIKRLEKIAVSLRREVLTATTRARSGHIGGSLSATDIVAALYFHHIRHDPKNPKWEDRDRFILSKGHACPVVYAALARAGYFSEEELCGLRKVGCTLQGHPDMNKTPGIEASTGTLGQGLSIGEGIALAARMDGKSYRVYVLLGDGELDEGQVWEAAMSGSHYQIDNLTAIVDSNGHQLSGPTKNVMTLEPLADKWRAFGWHVIEIDGHRMKQILDSLDEAEKIKGKPTVIIARTLKGKGVSFVEKSFAEGHHKFHGVPLTEPELAQALEELHE